MKSGKLNPRDAKRRLARELVTLYHSSVAAHRAEEEFDKIFARKETPDEIADFYVAPNEAVPLAKLIVESGGAKTNSEARRLIDAGGVRLDGERVNDATMRLKLDKTMLLKVGKRFFVRLVPKTFSEE